MDGLFGLTASKWGQLLVENRFAVAPKYWKRVAIITLQSARNSVVARKEYREYGDEIEQAEIAPPVFIIGHWRSGTTLLHNLLTRDANVAYPNLFEVSNPHTFLSTEEQVANHLSGASNQKRPMDNMKITMFSPGEEEFALSSMTLRSPVIGWSFPRREPYYDRYLTFEGVPAPQVQEWKDALITFMKKLTVMYGKRLVMKSPTHTARVKLLLEMFPEARFVHIARNPYTVFKSTCRLYEKAVPPSYLHDPDPEQQNDGIIRRYKMMYDAYFEQRALIPPGQLCEVRLEDLEQDMVGQVACIYEQLNLDGYPVLEPELRRYVNSLQGYKKNRHSALPDTLRNRVREAWQPSFLAWDYSP